MVIDTTFACDEQVLTYISGYVVHKFLTHEQCSACVNCFVCYRDLELSLDSDVNISYIRTLDRGGLKYPTLLTLMFGYEVYCTVQMLISDKYENIFLHASQQKALVCCLTMESVQIDDFFSIGMFRTL